MHYNRGMNTNETINPILVNNMKLLTEMKEHLSTSINDWD